MIRLALLGVLGIELILLVIVSGFVLGRLLHRIRHRRRDPVRLNRR